MRRFVEVGFLGGLSFWINGGIAAQWLAVSSHSEMVLGLNLLASCRVKSLYVVLVSACGAFSSHSLNTCRLRGSKICLHHTQCMHVWQEPHTLKFNVFLLKKINQEHPVVKWLRCIACNPRAPSLISTGSLCPLHVSVSLSTCSCLPLYCLLSNKGRNSNKWYKMNK